MFVEYHPEAETELDTAARDYELRVEGLGEAFLKEYLATLDQVTERPLTWRKNFGEVRMLNLRRFPVGIIYLPTPEKIYIVAVMPLRRHPDYWKKRL